MSAVQSDAFFAIFTTVVISKTGKQRKGLTSLDVFPCNSIFHGVVVRYSDGPVVTGDEKHQRNLKECVI